MWLFATHILSVKWSKSCSVVSNSLGSHRLYSSWNSPGQNTGVGRLSLFQGIFPTQGSNPGHPHCWRILHQRSHEGSPRILEWVAYLFSSESSWPRNWTGVSCIAGGFFTHWAIREALLLSLVTCLFRPLVLFFFFTQLSSHTSVCKSSVYILDKSPCDICFTNTFSQSLTCLFIYLTLYFEEQNF